MQACDTPALQQLAADLARVRYAKLATQQEIAAATGVSQGTVSKALRGRLKRETPQTRALQQYSNNLLAPKPWSEALERAARGFMARGGEGRRNLSLPSSSRRALLVTDEATERSRPLDHQEALRCGWSRTGR